MPKLHLPPSETIRSWLASLSDEPLSYLHSGGVTSPPERGFLSDRHRSRVGQGPEDFLKARAALRSWQMFPEWVRVVPPDASQQPGVLFASVMQILGLVWINPCRILQTIDEQSGTQTRAGFLFGTLPAHVECGEERFLIELLADGSVWYELMSFSRPRHWMAWAGFPLARWWQLKFVRDSQKRVAAAISDAPAEAA